MFRRPAVIKHYHDTSRWPYVLEESEEGGMSFQPFRTEAMAFYGCFIWVFLFGITGIGVAIMYLLEFLGIIYK